MTLAALFAVFLALSLILPRTRKAVDRSAPRHWLVLPDAEPARGGLPAVIPVCATLPALHVSARFFAFHAQGPDEGPGAYWRRPFLVYGVALAFGAVSLDLSAASLGVPEITLQDHGRDHTTHGFQLAPERPLMPDAPPPARLDDHAFGLGAAAAPAGLAALMAADAFVLPGHLADRITHPGHDGLAGAHFDWWG
jgi:hypothetical protein